jgi:hypothetical protein
MLKKDPEKVEFFGVSMFLIFAGIAVFTSGAVTWLFNYFGGYGFATPSYKIIGGLVVMGLSYVVMELELIRKK